MTAGGRRTRGEPDTDTAGPRHRRSIAPPRPTVLGWISYAQRSGAFLPRLVTVPGRLAGPVDETLRSGVEGEPDVEPADPAVRAAFLLLGASFLGAAIFLQGAIAAEPIRLYVAATVGNLGAVLCLAGLRGISGRRRRSV